MVKAKKTTKKVKKTEVETEATVAMEEKKTQGREEKVGVVVGEEQLAKIKDLAQELVNLIGVKGEVQVAWDEENGAVKIQIDSEESGLLIGRHGATIEALQVVLGAMTLAALGEWVRVICNVGDYREQREETLAQVAMNTAKKAKFSGEAQFLVGLSPAERRIVHMTLADDGEIETFSEGEGEERRLVIKPK